MNQPLHWLAHLGRIGRLDIHPGGAAASDWLLDALDFQPGQRVLELGCGCGQTLVRVASRHDVTIEAVDLLPEMRRTAARRVRLAGYASRVTIQAADFTIGLPFDDERFDRVYGESVIAFHEPAQVDFLLGEVHRVLKPGGRLGVVEGLWAAGQDPAAVDAVNAAAIADFGLRPASPLPWSVDDWRDRLAAAGLADIEADRMPNDLPPPQRPPKLRASSLLSRVQDLQRRVVPGLARAEAEYRRKLARPHDNPPQMESWRLLARREATDA